MKLARVFDGVDPSGEPFFAADRAHIDDAEERTRVSGFLKGGRVVGHIPGYDIDRMERDRGKVVPMSIHTDGVWIWNAGLRYYVETYGLAPEPEFLAHIMRSGHVAAEPDDAAVREALEILRASQRPG
jgi:hypothetical protein